jgi:16S rRNA (adenine1518-N6/adenine1519-N6)-dimethyltransferase
MSIELTDPEKLKKFLGRHHLSADKSLGQHFLCSQSVISAMMAALGGIEGALEIGPGPGILTGALCRTVSQVTALEVDERMIAPLAEIAPQAQVQIGDALQRDLGTILDTLPAPRAVVSNLPYYITGSLVGQIASARAHFDRAVLMMQKEVAMRILSPAGGSERGSLSVYLQFLFDIEKVVDAPANLFVPPPKVDSTVLLFRPRVISDDPEVQERILFLVRIGFAQRRKTLINNLVAGRMADRDKAIAWVEAAGLKPTARPQELSEAEWRRLAQVEPNAVIA